MIEETGVVIELKGSGMALVRAMGGATCEGCKCQAACHALGGGTERRVTAINRAGAIVGDRVLMTIGSGSFLKASFLVYLLPALSLVVGSFMGARYSSQIWPGADSEVVSVLIGLFGMGASFLVIRLFNTRLSQDRSYYPVIEEVVPSPGSSFPGHSLRRDG